MRRCVSRSKFLRHTLNIKRGKKKQNEQQATEMQMYAKAFKILKSMSSKKEVGANRSRKRSEANFKRTL